ncbi:Transcription initiation factor TFIIF subunit alpha [Fasciola gigantica]|uniref:Transcription initiation factor IIF subunit alpha n=1 Tax=Fasciola gigantica TaxID=46835 RepID=A0A504Z1T4_FASGI|nr:Transcription initiation factor TFIIF subunit alpha [Fasciola gigantica]
MNLSTIPADKTEAPNATVQNTSCVVRTTLGHPVVTTLSAVASTTAPLVVVRTLASAPTTITSGGIKIASLGSQPVKISTLSPATSVIRATASPAHQNPIGLAPVRPLVATNTTVKPEPVGTTQAATAAVKSEAPTPQRNVIREMQVRVPNRRDKRFSVLRFHSADRPDLSSGLEVFMQRENNLKQFRSLNNLAELPDRGAGSEFGREAKEEARLKKFGVVRESYRPDDQPWVMTVGKGKTGRRRFKGVKEGSVSNNVEYFVFCQCKDGNFDAYPIHAWYKMKPEINYRFLREDEAEVEYSRMNKTMNLFNVMIKRKLTDGDEEDAMLERELGKELKFLSGTTENRPATEGESSSSRVTKEQKGAGSGSTGRRSGDRGLKLTDLEELDHASDADDDDDEADEEEDTTDIADTSKGSNNKKRGTDVAGKTKVPMTAAERARLLRKKQRDAEIVTRMRRLVKKRKKKSRVVGSSSEDDDLNEEALDDSEVDDHEGDEVDYMTNSSSDEEKLSEEDREKIYVETGVDEEAGLKALLTDLSSDEEDEEEAKARAAEDLEDVDDSTVDGDTNSRKRRPGDGDKGDAGTGSLGVSQSDLLESSGKLSRSRKKRTAEDDNTGGLSSSSSSSSSIDGESSSYSSSSSDLETNVDEKIKRNSKKAAVFQKLSESIHGTTSSTGSGATGDAINTGLKRKPLDTSSDSPGLTGSTSSTTQPALKKSRLDSSSVSCDSELMSTVRKYLMRKPITVKELLRKIRIRKLVDKNEDAQAVLAGVLRQLRPIKQIINGQSALSLKH